MSDELDLRDGITAELAEIARTRMPFGRYGPERYPPAGLPIYEIPAEYLAYFATKGWPKGRLGVLLQIVYQMKVDGSEPVLKAICRRRSF